MNADSRQQWAKQKLLPVFTSKVLKELVVFGSSVRIDEARHALVSSGLIKDDSSIGHVFNSAYSILLESYPAEYVLLNECICAQVTRADEVSAYREQAVAGTKADLSIFWSGHASGYEVKSRYDRLDRLQTQLQTYQQVFSHTYVVTDREYVPRVLEYSPDSVGVLSVGRDGIQDIRPATERPDLIRLDRLFALLRKAEYLQLIRAEFGAVPRVPNTRIYQACFELFYQIDAARAQSLVMAALWRRRSRPSTEPDRAWRLPRSLRALALTGTLTQPDLLRLSYLLER